MNQNILTREKVEELMKTYIESGNGNEFDLYWDFLGELQSMIFKHLEAYDIRQIAIPIKHQPGMFTFLRCGDLKETACILGCESRSVEPDLSEFEEYFLDLQSLDEILQTIQQLKEHGIPSSEWHKAQELSVYCNTRDLLTRRQAMEIKGCLIKAKNDNDWKEYARQSTKIQKGIVAILESHGIRQIALKLKDRPGYNFIRIMNPDNLDGWGDCFLETCESENETPDPDDFMDSIETPDTLVEILDLIDRYKERGIPVSEWGKGHILN